MILGRDREGQPYRETMSTVSFSLHGCCYQSWHNSEIGAKVELRLTEGLTERSPLVRARVRYVRPPMNHSGLFQIGVEFDTPPREWLSLQLETTWGRAPHVGLTLKPERTSSVPETKPPTAQHLAVAQQELAVADRVTTIDQLIAVLQGPLQRAAENAVEAGRVQLEETVKRSVQLDVATQLDEAVHKLLSMINEIRRATKEEVSRQVDARLEELLGLWEDQQE